MGCNIYNIKGRWSPPVLDWYGYLALLEYNEDNASEIETKLDLIEQNLDNIQENLSNTSQNSSELKLILSNLMNIRKELYSLKKEIDSLDAFVKISEESLKRPHAKWFEALFKEDVEKYCVKSLGTRVSRINSKLNFLELERKDLFDVAVAMYSTTLQRENFEKEWEGMQEQIKITKRNTWIALGTAIVSIMISIVSFYFSIKSAKEQIQKMDKQIQEMKKLTDKQIEASREDIKILIEEIKNLKQKENK